MDRSSLRTQLERLHRESYGWALHCCARHPDEAADVLQTVYLKILEDKARYDGKATFKTWLFAVIRNTAADAHRRHEHRRALQHRLRLVREEASFQPVVPQEHLEESVDRAHLRAWFRQALADLSERQREVLHLVMYHDLTLEEAAQVMGVSLGSARTHYARGKQQLRQRLKATGTFDAPG
ncbi:MAG: RNA polymerase sigma factor [Rhodothermales bacterium]